MWELIEKLVLECMDEELSAEEREFSMTRLLCKLNEYKLSYIGGNSND